MEKNITVNLNNSSDFVSVEEVIALAQQSLRHLDALNSGTGTGNDFLGWL